VKRANDTLYQRFADIVREVDGWMNIDQFLALCDEHGVFDAQAQAEMVTNYKKAEIRKMLRRMAKHSADDGMGKKCEWVNLIIQTPDGHSQQVYKQLALFDAGDFVQVVRERMSRVKYWQAEVQRLVELAVARFGPRIQDMLPFKDALGAGEAA
jgi:hypothetical protein